jgi:Icc-related predicted phosphoesterase
MVKPRKKLRIAAVGDIHFSENDITRYRQQFEDISNHADVFAICGDLTQHGRAKEASVLAEELKYCRIPVIGVLGNHDYDKDEADAIREAMQPAMKLLDDEPVIINDVGFAGVKGFGGGFGKNMLPSFGEQSIKSYVRCAVEEVLRLENALKQLETDKKVAVLHYSPIVGTLVGEPPEIYSFLGTARLEEPIDFLNVDLVVHGHAHHGSPKGQTREGIPVYNVALTQLTDPEKPYLLLEA